MMSESSGPTSAHGQQPNLRMLLRLLVVTAAMFAFGYALIPLYKVFCDLTGINQLTKRNDDAARFARNTQVDSSRSVVIEFDANARGALRFVPVQHSMSIHPGALTTIEYELINTRDQKTVGQAIPSYAPARAAQYFHKLQCFCFDQQTMGPGERRRFPVVFVVDPKLPADVGTITLSYTFFEVEGAVTDDRSAAAPVRAQAVKG